MTYGPLVEDTFDEGVPMFAVALGVSKAEVVEAASGR